MSEPCKWLHKQLEQLPLIKFPFIVERLPRNGIYFFYETGELGGHNRNTFRIVRIGTHKKGNFRSRIMEHYLFNEVKMNFDKDRSKPSDRSIFRKNIGRALLHKDNDEYLQIWDIDFTIRRNRESFGCQRDIDKEKRIESVITEIIRERFFFRYIVMESQMERMGSRGLESSLIGTVASCKVCKPSANWLGNYSPKQQLMDSGLWLVQHLKAGRIDENEKNTIITAIRNTQRDSILAS